MTALAAPEKGEADAIIGIGDGGLKTGTG